ncbi:hypothetical protein K7432_015538, partial [Basidiobolus ranarum]
MAKSIRDEEVPRLFEDLLNEMGLDDSKKTPLRVLPLQHKKSMLRAQKDLKAQDVKHLRSGRFDSMPEFYIRKLTDVDIRYLSVRDLSSLRVSLTTQSLTWVNQFIQLKGLRYLSNILVKFSSTYQRSNSDNQIEHEVVRCLKALFNTKSGIKDALIQPKSVTNLCFSLDSPLIGTRKLVVEVMIFLCHYELPVGLNQVLKGIHKVEHMRKEYGAFEAWLRPFEATIDGHRRLGSTANPAQYNDQELVDYILSNLILLNSIVGNCNEVELRIHIRTQMNAVGLRRAIRKVKVFADEAINLQVSKYLFEAEQDLLYLMDSHAVESDDGSSITTPSLPDTSDPLTLFQILLSSVENTTCYHNFLSIHQHMVMIPSDPVAKQKIYKLIDRLVMQIILDDTGMPQDLSNTYGISVGNLLSRFGNEDKIDELQEELRKAKMDATRAHKKRSEVEMQLGMINDGLFGNMKTRIASLEDMLAMSRNTVELQKNQIAQLTKKVERLNSRHPNLHHSDLSSLALPTSLSFPNPDDFIPSCGTLTIKSGKVPYVKETANDYWRRSSTSTSTSRSDLIYNAGPSSTSTEVSRSNLRELSPFHSPSFSQYERRPAEVSQWPAPPETHYSHTLPHYTGGLSPVSPVHHHESPERYNRHFYRSGTPSTAPMAYEPVGSGYASDYYGGSTPSYIPQIGGFPFPTLPNQTSSYNHYDWNPSHERVSHNVDDSFPPSPQTGHYPSVYNSPTSNSQTPSNAPEISHHKPPPLPPRPSFRARSNPRFKPLPDPKIVSSEKNNIRRNSDSLSSIVSESSSESTP